MVHNPEILQAFDKLQQDPKVTILKIVKGKKGFILAQKLLNREEHIADASWASTWTEKQKKDALFVLYRKKIRVNDKIGFKLYIGEGPNFAGVGELHPEKKAVKIWQEFIKDE